MEPILASALGRASAVWQGGELLVRLPAGPLSASLATPDNAARLAKLLAELAGPGHGLRLELAPAPPEAAAGPGSPAGQAGQTAAVADLAEHPAVQEALEIFEAQVVALNPAEKQE